jgi:exonuclease III
MDNENAKCKRPERRSAIVALELQKNDIDIAALSETRLADEGKLTEMGGGYTFFWKCKLKEEPRHHGVGFAIKNKLVNQLQENPCGISERLMTLRLSLSKNRFATIISAYAPTMQADEETKERFYSDLNHILARTPIIIITYVQQP